MKNTKQAAVTRKGATRYHSGKNCPCCESEVKLRHREFSAQAWAFLVENEEISVDHVGEAICDTCYRDLRELLIESFDGVGSMKVSTDIERRLSQVNTREVNIAV